MTIDATHVTTRVGSIELRRGGSGEPIVYLHSAAGEGPGLELLDRLAEGAEVIAPMFCGFETSDGIEQIDDMDDAVFHLLDLFDVLGLETPTVVGLSFGGWMAAELAVRYPERVGHLVLINPVGLYIRGAEIKDIFGRAPSEMADDMFASPDHPVAQMMRMMETSFAELARGSEIPFELIRPQVQALSATARLGWNPYLHDPKLAGRLHRVTAPTLVIRGEHDSLVPSPHCLEYAAAIAHSTHEVMPDAAHMICLEQPAELAARILSFATS